MTYKPCRKWSSWNRPHTFVEKIYPVEVFIFYIYLYFFVRWQAFRVWKKMLIFQRLCFRILKMSQWFNCCCLLRGRGITLSWGISTIQHENFCFLCKTTEESKLRSMEAEWQSPGLCMSSNKNRRTKWSKT